MKLELDKYLKGFDALLISSHANITYLTGYSGFSETERECFLLITKQDNYLITDKRYSEAVKKIIKNFKIIDTGAYVFLKNDGKNLFEKLKIKKLGFEENNLTVGEYSSWRKLTKLRPVDLRDLRLIKKNNEIKNIKLACKIGDETFNYVISIIKTGVTEKEIANQIELFIKEKNAETSFRSIVAFGKNSAIPHHQSGNTKLKKNQIVLLDFGVKINNYCSDMSRTVFFGEAPNEFKHTYNTVFEAQKKAFEFLNSSILNHESITGNDIDKVARDYIIKQKYPSIPHSLGHGVGIEVHESPHISPNSNETIKNRMIFSIEPGIYNSGFGGVRIEDLCLLIKNQILILTKSSRKLIEIRPIN